MWPWLRKLWASLRLSSPQESQPNRAEQLLGEFHQVNHRYHPIGLLGQGGFGEVYSCFDHTLNRLTARKSLKAPYRKDPAQLRSLINEARLISYLDHPGVVAVFDAYTDEEGAFQYTMELIEGVNLQDELRSIERRGEYMSLSRSLRLLIRLCQTMAYVHQKGVLHLDLKSENIMLGDFGELYILDWGNAYLYAPERYHSYLSRNGKEVDISEVINDSVKIVGTPPYMSPEQTYRQRKELTPASDIFSVGVMLYRMLTGIFPFSLLSTEEFLRELHMIEPKPLHFHRGDVPLRLSQICAKMLAKRVEERYSDFKEVVEDLQSLSEFGQVFDRQFYQAGEVFIHEGERGDCAYQILDGQVEVYRTHEGNEHRVATLGPGEMIGELSIFSQTPRSASVRAIIPTTVYVIGDNEIMAELEKLNPWVGRMIHSLSSRFLEQMEQQDSGDTGESSEDVEAARRLANVIQDQWKGWRAKTMPPIK